MLLSGPLLTDAERRRMRRRRRRRRRERASERASEREREREKENFSRSCCIRLFKAKSIEPA